MQTVRIGQVLALMGCIMVVFAGAAAQTTTPAPAVAPAALPGLEYLGYIREVGFPAAAFLLLFYLVRTTLRENTAALQELVVVVRELRVHCQREK